MRKRETRSVAGTTSPVPRELVTARRVADIVSVPKRRCLAIDGAGSPHDASFRTSIEALFGVAYTLTFARKSAGKGAFKVGPLEGRWSADVAATTSRPAPEHWRWRLRIGVPDSVTSHELEQIKRDVLSKKNGKLQGSTIVPKVFLESLPAQRVGRILHVGPYSQEDASFALISAALEHAGLQPAQTHIEVYRKDPGRTRPEALETVLLRELAA